MTTALTIALDGMGGDRAPDIVVAGAFEAHVRFPEVRFLLFGDQNRLQPLIEKMPRLAAAVEIRHTSEKVGAEDRPSQALRHARRSSMRLAIDSVAAGEALGVVSAGNTGALMAMAKFVLKTLPGIERPAIASLLPTLHGETVVLDLGANIECTADNLVQFAIMGANFANKVLGRPRPTVGLMNVGVEELKGNEAVRSAADILRSARGRGFEFIGFIEGDDIGKGTVDVVVTDGFTGNVALKTIEGTAKLFTTFLSQAFRRSIASQLGYLLARPALAALKAQFDPRQYNGGVLLGLNGIVVKSHGGTDATGFAAAVALAVDLAAENITEALIANFKSFQPSVTVEAKAALS